MSAEAKLRILLLGILQECDADYVCVGSIESRAEEALKLLLEIDRR
jgi:hypothetical protein